MIKKAFDIAGKAADKLESASLNGIYTIGRKLGWLGYTTIPTYTYLDTNYSLQKNVYDYGWYNPMRWFVELFGSDKINTAKGINHSAEHGMGIGGALGFTKLINIATERIKSPTLRNILETGTYAATAVGADAIANSKDFNNTLENLAINFSSPEAFANALTQTLAESADALYKFTAIGEYPASAFGTAAAVLTALSAYRVIEALDRATFRKNPIRKLRDFYIEKQQAKRRIK